MVGLSGCGVGSSLFQNEAATQPETKVLSSPPAPAYRPHNTAGSASGITSRLDSQPWPSRMGQPLNATSSGNAVTTYPLATSPQNAVANPGPSSMLPPAPTSIADDGKIKVALLVPLSGKNAPLGQAMVNAAQLAVFDVANSHFELMPRDTGGKPASAELAARDAMASGAQLFIGPLFAPDVTAVKPLVQTSPINMLALSTDVTLAEPGAYIMGFAPAPQVERVVSYAASRGLKRIAAIVPGGAYGALVDQALHRALAASGATLVEEDSPSNLARLGALKDSIDAILLPFGGAELQQIADKLSALGLSNTKVRYLGTGLWDAPDLGKTAPSVVGGWYAASEPDARAHFVEAYKEAYGVEPPRLATLAYDATALAAILASHHMGYDRASLEMSSGFAGTDGLFRLTHQGTAERGLAILEVGATNPTLADPAPSRF